MENIKNFADRNKITLDTSKVPENPFLQDESWEADHWYCVLNMGDKKFKTYFSLGVGHRKPLRPQNPRYPAWHKANQYCPPPSLESVLGAVAMDCSSFYQDGLTFEEWAGEFGYDTDSRSAEKTFNNCMEQMRKFKEFLGRGKLDELVEIAMEEY